MKKLGEFCEQNTNKRWRIYFIDNYVVVSNAEGEATFKQLKKYGGTRVPHPLNSKYDDIELGREIEYRVVGVVVEKKKRYR